jgi:hypothetical protein
MGTRQPCRRSNARARDPPARDQPWPRPQLLAPKDQMIGVDHVERRLLIGQPELPLELLGHPEVVLVQERQPDAGRVPRAGVPGTAGPNVRAANALWVIARPRGPRPGCASPAGRCPPSRTSTRGARGAGRARGRCGGQAWTAPPLGGQTVVEVTGDAVTRWSRGGNGTAQRRLGGQAERGEEAPLRVGLGHRAQDPPCTATMRTDEDLDREHPAPQRGPRQPARPRWPFRCPPCVTRGRPPQPKEEPCPARGGGPGRHRDGSRRHLYDPGGECAIPDALPSGIRVARLYRRPPHLHHQDGRLRDSARLAEHHRLPRASRLQRGGATKDPWPQLPAVLPRSRGPAATGPSSPFHSSPSRVGSGKNRIQGGDSPPGPLSRAGGRVSYATDEGGGAPDSASSRQGGEGDSENQQVSGRHPISNRVRISGRRGPGAVRTIPQALRRLRPWRG